MERFNETSSSGKQRHGCVTAWLILMIVLNSITALVYLVAGESISRNFPQGISNSLLMLLAFIGILNTVFAILLFRWKRWAFWGFAFTSLITFTINLSIGIGLGQSILGFAGVAILFGIMQIERNGVSAWKNLE